MRLYHHLNAPDEAYTVYKNEVIKVLPSIMLLSHNQGSYRLWNSGKTMEF